MSSTAWRAARRPSTTGMPRRGTRTSARRSWGATCSGRSAARGRTRTWRGWWGEDPPFHTPVFVLTHHERAPLEMEGGTTFHFVTDGIESALEQAVAAAERQGRHARRRRLDGAAVPARRTRRRAHGPRRARPARRRGAALRRPRRRSGRARARRARGVAGRGALPLRARRARFAAWPSASSARRSSTG